MREENDTRDLEMARIAARQHGVVSVEQLHEVGLGKSAISRRLKRGRLHRIHRGVYAVGHKALSWHGRWMAAVLACGEGAVLSHGSAAALWGLLRPLEGPTHISTPSTSGRTTRRGIHVHRCPSLIQPSSSPSYPPAEGGRGRRPSTTPALTTYRDNIPVTTVGRTIEDLRTSSLIPPHLVRRAIRQAELKGLRLDGIATDRTRSDLETAFLTLFAQHRIPPPEVNPKIGRYEVDFLWRDQRLVVEADTFLYHRGSISFEDDHARDLDLRSAGYTVKRYTDRQLETDPERIVADVRQALAEFVSPPRLT
jgi:very-short-patch-repair endonuclease